jgi:hypothetical protein
MMEMPGRNWSNRLQPPPRASLVLCAPVPDSERCGPDCELQVRRLYEGSKSMRLAARQAHTSEQQENGPAAAQAGFTLLVCVRVWQERRSNQGVTLPIRDSFETGFGPWAAEIIFKRMQEHWHRIGLLELTQRLNDAGYATSSRHCEQRVEHVVGSPCGQRQGRRSLNGLLGESDDRILDDRFRSQIAAQDILRSQASQRLGRPAPWLRDSPRRRFEQESSKRLDCGATSRHKTGRGRLAIN